MFVLVTCISVSVKFFFGAAILGMGWDACMLCSVAFQAAIEPAYLKRRSQLFFLRVNQLPVLSSSSNLIFTIQQITQDEAAGERVAYFFFLVADC